jgi:hypothetical protein
MLDIWKVETALGGVWDAMIRTQTYSPFIVFRLGGVSDRHGRVSMDATCPPPVRGSRV